MTGNNGHATKRFAETRSRASCAFKGVLGALPRQAEGSFRGGENSPKMQKRGLFALLAKTAFIKKSIINCCYLQILCFVGIEKYLLILC